MPAWPESDLATALGSPVASPSATPAEWLEIFALLDTALDLEPTKHDAWLAALSPDKARLAPLLKELLQTHATGGASDFMRLPATFALPELTPSSAPLALQASAQIGPYRLLREIGQGGMATVWLAERADGLLDRQVALKLPHMSWGSTALAERMARERNILASLTHPNIARLYDAGIAADGRPFLALEYVAGKPIDVYSHERQLGVRSKLGLIVQVARAVAHAHAHLVVHRDLKPSNILVDEQGQAHLLDFGIAKLIDPALVDDAAEAPRTQVRALTPDYASPEQIRGDVIGTASDVYSLGVVLFELLVGERPYRLQKGLSALALAEAIRQTDAPRASATATDPALRRQLQGDLDAILARALAKASNQRYANIDALADDSERHLRGEPVRARPDSAWYRAERWVRKHKLETAVAAAIVIAVPAGAAAQAAVLVAMAAGAGVALWQARVARQQTKIAKEEAARAAAVKGFLTSFFKSGSLEEDGGARLGRLSVQEFVERGARKIDLGFESEPALKNELFDVVSTLFADLSDGKQTVEYARKWQLSLEQLGAGEPERARAAQRLAQGLALQSHSAEAVGVLTQSITRLRQRASQPTLLAQLLVAQAEVQTELGDLASAMASVDEALVLLATPPPSDKAALAAHGAALFQRGEVVSLNNKIAEAIPVFEAAFTTLARVHGERSLIVGKYRLTFASHLANGHQAAAAEREFRHAIQIFHDAGGEQDLNAAIVKIYLGRTLVAVTDRHGARAEGLALLAQARDVFDSRAGKVSPHYAAQTRLYITEALVEDGELSAAREPMQACLAFFSQGVDNPLQRANVQLIHARFQLACGVYDEAIGSFEDARALRADAHGPTHPLTVALGCRIGQVHVLRGQFAQAQTIFQGILQIDDHGEAVWGTVKQLVRMSLAVAQLEQGNVAQALPALQLAFDHFHANAAKARYLMSEAEVSVNLGRAFLLGGQEERALPLLQRAVDATQAKHPKSPTLASHRAWLGLCCLALGDTAQARALADLAQAALDAEPSAGMHYRRSLALLSEKLAAELARG